jgi:hypothetical protein
LHNTEKKNQLFSVNNQAVFWSLSKRKSYRHLKKERRIRVMMIFFNSRNGPNKEDAIGYAKARAKFGRGEIRVLDAARSVESVISFAWEQPAILAASALALDRAV